MKKLYLSLCLGMIGCVIASAADFATEMLDATFKLFHVDSTGTDGHPLLVGMVLAQFRHDERVTMEYEERTIHHPRGLGTVLHAHFIRETIEQADQQHAANPK